MPVEPRTEEAASGDRRGGFATCSTPSQAVSARVPSDDILPVKAPTATTDSSTAAARHRAPQYTSRLPFTTMNSAGLQGTSRLLFRKSGRRAHPCFTPQPDGDRHRRTRRTSLIVTRPPTGTRSLPQAASLVDQIANLPTGPTHSAFGSLSSRVVIHTCIASEVRRSESRHGSFRREDAILHPAGNPPGFCSERARRGRAASGTSIPAGDRVSPRPRLSRGVSKHAFGSDRSVKPKKPCSSEDCQRCGCRGDGCGHSGDICPGRLGGAQRRCIDEFV